MFASLSSWEEMKYRRDQLAFSHSSTDTATRQAIACAHAGTEGGCTGALCRGLALSSSPKLVLLPTAGRSQDNLIGTHNSCSTSPGWPWRPDPGLSSSLFSPCSAPRETPLTEGCSYPVFGLLEGCRQLQDSPVEGFPRTSFANWALGQQRIMTLGGQVFFFVGKERGGQGKYPDCWIFFAAVAESLLSIY